MVGLEHRLRESREIIADVIAQADGLPLICNFSGGKDSQTVLLLMLEQTTNIRTMYLASGIDLPGSTDYAIEISRGYGFEPILSWPWDYFQLGKYCRFEDMVRHLGYFPTSQRNWCSGRLKFRPARAKLRTLFGQAALYKFTGVRRQESSRRRLMYKADEPVMPDPEHSGSFMVHPIINWSDGDVLAYLGQHDVKLISPLYKSTGVSGCFYCPFYQPAIIKRVERVFPGIYEPMIELEAEVGKPALGNHRWLKDVVGQVKAQLTMSL